MTYGIICAMGEELAILQGKLENGTSKRVGHTDFFEGTIANQPVVLVQSGIGKVQAAITASILINNFNVDTLINSGSAGGIGEGLSVGEVVVSTQTAYHDVDVTASNYEVGQLPGLPARFDADEELVDEIMAAAKASGMESQRGLIVSGDQFIADSQKIATIKKNFPDALCCEMEGAAIGQVAYENNVPYAVIRAMSDVGDEDADQSFDEFIIDAGKRSGQMLINLFEEQASRK
ncbi:5'-methylthioadenosine/adenosylhomocysteine nucleosidase [Lentilactobacillus kosonis]|uniref:adenosylhomocysteine nucleosidase n=1 Tax=Lentilactobacillus kosonis TaxID=2810561 RepID=A0A401FPD7_9LACO|nr:5'-methylthioadenosine/adenosylhomocysteine nucleosidase [Lentilactobacillus kosonis]GAY74081.1 5'-methylthioadenosine nucleosidase [Lentilactobacillus kosonis]